jgi:hypothetical protein
VTSTEIVQVVVCGRCAVRLSVAGPPAELGGSAVFSVRCPRCQARIPLACAVSGVTSVAQEPIKSDSEGR